MGKDSSNTNTRKGASTVSNGRILFKIAKGNLRII